MTDRASILKVSNGYVVSFDTLHEIYPTLDDVFNRLLLNYEGLSTEFGGDIFGAVIINRGRDLPRKAIRVSEEE